MCELRAQQFVHLTKSRLNSKTAFHTVASAQPYVRRYSGLGTHLHAPRHDSSVQAETGYGLGQSRSIVCRIWPKAT